MHQDGPDDHVQDTLRLLMKVYEIQFCYISFKTRHPDRLDDLAVLGRDR